MNECVGFSGGVLAAGDGLHHGRRAEHHVAGVENASGFRDRQFGTAADGGNHQVELAEDRRFLLADDEILRSRLFARWQYHAGKAKAGDAFALVNDGQRLGATGDLNTVFEQHVALILRQRHVLLPTAINQFNGGSAETFGRRRAIRRHGAATEDGDLFAFEFELLLVFKKCLPRQHEFLAGNVQLDRLSQAGANDDGIEILTETLQCDLIPGRAVRPRGLADRQVGPTIFIWNDNYPVLEFDVAEAFEKGDVCANHLLIQPEVRNQVHRPAKPLLLFVNRNLVAVLQEHARRAQACRPGADDGDGFPIRRQRTGISPSRLRWPF